MHRVREPGAYGAPTLKLREDLTVDRIGVSWIPAALAVVLCATVTGCVNTRTTQLADGHASAWKGKSVALTNRPSAGFMPVTTGKAMFGLIGAVAMVEAGKTIVAENSLEDPAPQVGRRLRDAAVTQFGIVPAAIPPVSIDETDITKLASAARGADLLFDVQLTAWGLGYKPFSLHYYVSLGIKLRLIDVEKQTLIAEGYCFTNERDKEAKDLPTYNELMADHAALLKSKLQAHTDACVEELEQKVLNIAPGQQIQKTASNAAPQT